MPTKRVLKYDEAALRRFLRGDDEDEGAPDLDASDNPAQSRAGIARDPTAMARGEGDR